MLCRLLATGFSLLTLLSGTACSRSHLGQVTHTSAAETAGVAPVMGQAAPDATAPLPMRPGSKCHLRTTEQWQDFVVRNAYDSRWSETCEDSTCNEVSHDFVQEFVARPLDDCADVIALSPHIERCTERLRRFVPTWVRYHELGTYGFKRTNHDYLHSQDAATMPEGMMTPPPALIAALPTRAGVEEAARRNGWRFLTHNSAIDNIRTFVLVPDPQGRFDQWMILNLAAPGEGSAALVFSVLAVQKADRIGQPLGRVRLHFRDYDVVPKVGAGFDLAMNEKRDGKCYGCHISGTRKLIDRETPVTASRPVKGEPGYSGDAGADSPAPAGFGVKRLGELNQILMSYGLPDWGGDVAVSDHGPMLGAEQGCTSCHNGTVRGPLTITTSEVQIGKKISDQLGMPPEPGLIALRERSELRPESLTAADRSQLQGAQARHDQLLDAYLGSRLPELNSWLLAEPCL